MALGPGGTSSAYTTVGVAVVAPASVAVVLIYALVCCCKAHALLCCVVLNKPRVVNCIRVSLYSLE